MIDLNRKKILFFTSSFFEYELEIKKKLESMGATVYLFDERPSNNPFVKAIIRLGKQYIGMALDQHYNRIILSLQGTNFDYVLIIKGETLNQKRLEKLKYTFSNAKFILYMWDSLKNYPHIKNITHSFDSALTFDHNDSLAYNDFKFRPLFYLDMYKEISHEKKKQNFTIDLLFVGTIHSDRWIFLNQIKQQAESHNLKVYFFLYIPSFWIFIFKKLFTKEFSNLSFKNVHFTSISKKAYLELLKKSRCVVDIQHPGQTGLTMRTIEVVGAGRKLITTNETIKDYDFYHTQNIQVISRKNPKLDRNFCSCELKELSDSISYKYSLQGWLSELFTN
jgi:hypothetical protein